MSVEVAHRTEGQNPTEDVDAAAIDRKLVDLAKGGLILELGTEARASAEEKIRHQKSAEAIVGSGMRRPLVKG